MDLDVCRLDPRTFIWRTMMLRRAVVVRVSRGCTIYALVDPRSPQDWRYIGQAYDARTRLREHRMEAVTRRKVQTPKVQWLRLLLSEAVEPQLVILESNVSPSRAVERESYWINRAAAEGHKIT